MTLSVVAKALRALARPADERRKRDFERFAAKLDAGIHDSACPQPRGRACMCGELFIFRRWNDDFFRLPPDDRAAFYTAVAEGFLCVRHERKRVRSAWGAFCKLAKQPCVVVRTRARRSLVQLELAEDRDLPAAVVRYLETVVPPLDRDAAVESFGVLALVPMTEAIGLARMLVRLGALAWTPSERRAPRRWLLAPVGALGGRAA